jgi:methylamine---glutamate N-methyltransferase subunit A
MMCGNAGLLYTGPRQSGPLGQHMLRMLDVLGSRGVDGTGVALYGPPQPDALIFRVWLGGKEPPAEQAERAIARLKQVATLLDAEVRDDYLRLVVAATADPDPLVRALHRDAPGLEVFSLGHSMEIVKQMGPAAVLSDRYCVSTFVGTHGIGHTRLATESKVDVKHCHPYWARPFADIAVVHNGQLTNYYKQRRIFEMHGWQFETDGDSELIALYLAHRMQDGAGLEEAMRDSVNDLDGTFNYIVSTARGIGFARDMFATKPLVFAETPEYVAIATEERAIVQTFGGPLSTYEPPAREVRVWLR